MYYQHFGLNGPPFQFTSSPAMLYMSQTHREGMAALEWGLMHEASGFSLLAGESGTGKTTLIASLLSRQYPRLHIAYVTNPHLDFSEILKLILTQLEIEVAGRANGEMLDALGKFLGAMRPGERVVIIFDEAQGLSDEALEDLRLLSNYGRPGESQLQLIMAGHPELIRRLMAPNLRQFNERIGARTLLMPLDAKDTAEYIDYRLRAKNGTAAKIFHRKALKCIIAASAGIPRRVNVLCHNAMLLAYAAGANQVTLKMAREAVTDYQDLFNSALRASAAENPTPRSGWNLAWKSSLTTVAAAITGLLIALIALGSYFGRRTMPAPESANAADSPREQTLMLPHSPSIDSDIAADGSTAKNSSITPIARPHYESAHNSGRPSSPSSDMTAEDAATTLSDDIGLAKHQQSQEGEAP